MSKDRFSTLYLIFTTGYMSAYSGSRNLCFEDLFLMRLLDQLQPEDPENRRANGADVIDPAAQCISRVQRCGNDASVRARSSFKGHGFAARRAKAFGTRR